jgi:hypothetical protein
MNILGNARIAHKVIAMTSKLKESVALSGIHLIVDITISALTEIVISCTIRHYALIMMIV